MLASQAKKKLNPEGLIDFHEHFIGVLKRVYSKNVKGEPNRTNLIDHS